MATYKSIYAPIHDRARIIWSFLTILPLIGIVAAAALSTAPALETLAALAGIVDDPADLREYVKAQAPWVGDLIQLSPFILFILYTFIWVIVGENRSLGTIGFTMRSWFSRYVRGFVSGVLFLLAVIGVIYYLGGYQVEAMLPVAAAANPLLPVGVIGLFLIGFIIQGAAEEVVFRGWWMSALAARRGKAIALGVTSVLFALAHMGNVWPPTMESMIGVANIVLFGLFIGLYALKEESLWGVCGWHSAWNWLLGLGFGLEVSGQGIGATPLIVDLADAEGANTLITGGGFGPEASVVTTGVLMAGCLWFLMRGAMKPAG